MSKKRRTLLTLVSSFGVITAISVSCYNTSTQQKITPIASSDVKGVTSKPIPVPVFNKLLYATKEHTSLWAIINADNPIPSNYRPEDLEPIKNSKPGKIYVRSLVRERTEAMLYAASKESLNINVISGFRSYLEQQKVYLTSKEGIAAKPGYSEHQLGLAIDISTGFNENIWLSNHAHKFGFIIRYPENKQNITGFGYEPWHLRYVGVELATEIKNRNKTMEEYFMQ